jgi:HAD superfamily hydrolase (TIGR01459 family)
MHPQPVVRLSALSGRYQVLLCDVWGVLHNGAAIFPEAATALANFRERGGHVILLSNASRLGKVVNAQLAELGLTNKAYDSLITSGDITRDYVAAAPNCAIFDVGPGDAHSIFEGLDVRFTALEDAALAITSGAFSGHHDEVEQIQSLLCEMRSTDLLLLCANPDVITELAGCRVQCSGAVAERYAQLGGRVIYAGKPQKPIYGRALRLAAELRGELVRQDSVLVIGDSLRTDIAGATANGFDSLFLWGGIHAAELGLKPSRAELAKLFSRTAIYPTTVAHRLVW